MAHAHVTSGSQHARHGRNKPSQSSPRPVISSRVTWLVTFVTQGPARRIPSPFTLLQRMRREPTQGWDERLRPSPHAMLDMSAGKTHPGLSIVPVLDAVSRRDLLQHPREEPSDHGRLPSSIPDFAIPSPPRPYPNQPGHRTVTLLCDSSVPSGKFAPNYTLPGISRSLVRGCGLTFNHTLRAGGQCLLYMSQTILYIFSLAPTSRYSNISGPQHSQALLQSTERDGSSKSRNLVHGGNSRESCAIQSSRCFHRGQPAF